MLHPLKSILVVVDAPAPTTNTSSVPLTQLQLLTDASGLLAVPMLAARYPDIHTPGLIATGSSLRPSTVEIGFDPAVVDWVGTPLGTAIALTGRGQLIVCGFWLEEAITLLTLKCLAHGIDTYIPVDATAAFNPVNVPAAHARLTQAGAVPTTTEQVLREWGALSGDLIIQSKLISLIGGNSINLP